MSIALVCTGLGRVTRGYESFAQELFEVLRGSTRITLFKGGGRAGADEVVVANLPRDYSLKFRLAGNWSRAYRWEQISFSLGMLPHLLARKYTLVHYMDATLTGCLLRLRKRFNLKFQLLFKNGGAHTPEHYSRADFIQLLTPVQMEEAIRYGISSHRLSLLPMGLSARKFAPPPDLDRRLLRIRYGVPEKAYVILSVAALNLSDKRLDWLVQEAANFPNQDAYLLLAGHRGPETPELERLAAAAWPGRHKIVQVSHERIQELYWLSDIFVLPSIREGFGLAVLEAASARIPLLVHDSDHFRWLVGHPESRVDMTKPGLLASRLTRIRSQPKLQGEMIAHNLERVLQFDWDVLRGKYLAMYDQILHQGND